MNAPSVDTLTITWHAEGTGSVLSDCGLPEGWYVAQPGFVELAGPFDEEAVAEAVGIAMASEQGRVVISPLRQAEAEARLSVAALRDPDLAVFRDRLRWVLGR